MRPSDPAAIGPGRLARLAPLALLILPAVLRAPAAGQLIPLRTAPIVRADGFEMLPSRQLAMGGVSIAFSDTLGDPWSNPATAARIGGARLFAAPVAYDVSGRAGGGGAVPVGVIARSGVWFGAGALAFQSVQPGRIATFLGPIPLAAGRPDAVALAAPGEEDTGPSRNGIYGFALFGRSWPERGLAIGGSVMAAHRNAVDGIGLLYGETEGLDASGNVATFRLGLLAESSAGRSFEAVAVRSRTRMTLEPTYLAWSWDPEIQQAVGTPREERHADEEDVWGLRLIHAWPLAPGWRIGWLATANLATYPSLPRYDAPVDGVADIEAARGEARALNLGVGVAGTGSRLRLGADVVFEPIRSRIRGESVTGTTLENRIRYANAVARFGAGREWRPRSAVEAADLRFGLVARLVDYRLAQFDHRVGAGRDERDRWLEWTPTWGGGVHAGGVELRYHGSALFGTERPRRSTAFLPCLGICLLSIAPGPVGDRIVFRSVSVVTHQLFVSVPLGGAR